MMGVVAVVVFFFFNDTATTEIYTLSLHDALPISRAASSLGWRRPLVRISIRNGRYWRAISICARSGEHTSELQSQSNLVCRLLLVKKKKNQHTTLQRVVDSLQNAVASM